MLARNNDILSICIFSHFDGINDKFSSFLCHCGLEGEELGQKLSINGYHDDSKNYVPATKEQRNLLFKKMHEAGYEWDADRLELKKIEQKPAWSEEDERMYRGLHNLIYSTLYCDSRKESSDWLKSLKDRVQPQNTWNPSDEQMENLSRAVNGGSYRTSLLMELYQDLKKLKE